MSDTSIEWTEKTWNPVTGCSKVSPGCAHCYAETVALRFWPSQYPRIVDAKHLATPIDQTKTIDEIGDVSAGRVREFTDVMCHEDRLDQPLRWKKPRKVFVNSMSDLFHGDVPDAFIDRVFAVMALADRHTFQVLTKRAQRMRDYLSNEDTVTRIEEHLWEMHTDETTNAMPLGPLKNVWLGVSVENQHFADERIPLLLQTPAAVRFISAEPLLGPVNVRCRSAAGGGYVQYLPAPGPPDPPGARKRTGTAYLDWVIVGGESGAGARMCSQQWIRSIVDQCRVSRVPVFVKQIGKMSCFGEPGVNGGFRPKDHKGGDMAEWPEDLRVREMPTVTR